MAKVKDLVSRFEVGSSEPKSNYSSKATSDTSVSKSESILAVSAVSSFGTTLSFKVENAGNNELPVKKLKEALTDTIPKRGHTDHKLELPAATLRKAFTETAPEKRLTEYYSSSSHEKSSSQLSNMKCNNTDAAFSTPATGERTSGIYSHKLKSDVSMDKSKSEQHDIMENQAEEYLAPLETKVESDSDGSIKEFSGVQKEENNHEKHSYSSSFRISRVSRDTTLSNHTESCSFHKLSLHILLDSRSLISSRRSEIDNRTYFINPNIDSDHGFSAHPYKNIADYTPPVRQYAPRENMFGPPPDVNSHLIFNFEDDDLDDSLREGAHAKSSRPTRKWLRILSGLFLRRNKTKKSEKNEPTEKNKRFSVVSPPVPPAPLEKPSVSPSRQILSQKNLYSIFVEQLRRKGNPILPLAFLQYLLAVQAEKEWRKYLREFAEYIDKRFAG